MEKELTGKLAEANRKLRRSNEELDRLKILYEGSEIGQSDKVSWEKLMRRLERVEREGDGVKKEN